MPRTSFRTPGCAGTRAGHGSRRPAGVADHGGEQAGAGPVALGRASSRDLHRQLAARAGGDRSRRAPIRCPRWWPARTPDSRRWWCWNGSRPISGSRSCCTTGSPCRSPRSPRCSASARPPPGSWRRGRARPSAEPPPRPIRAHNEVVGKLMAAHGRRRSGSRGGAAASGRHLHRRLEWQGAHGGSRRSTGRTRWPGSCSALPRRYGPAMFTVEPVGARQRRTRHLHAPAARPATGYREMMPRITAVTVRDGKVCALWDIANPDKFTGSPLRSSR